MVYSDVKVVVRERGGESNPNTTHLHMNNNDREKFAINASNNREFLLGDC
jgi:hypothetical protein